MAAEVNKPDFSFQWASGGAIVALSDVKIQTGWTAEVPPFQWENFLQNRQDNAILHLFQKGISEWDAASNYYFTTSGTRSYVQGSDGAIYVALQDSVGQNPTTATAYWQKAFTSLSEVYTLLNGRSVTATSSGSFVVPAGVTSIRISGCAGGGGGGACIGSASGSAGNGSGGGAGEPVIGFLVSVTPGQVIPYTIGAAGNGGLSAAVPPTSGGNTTVGSGGSILTLVGGSAGGNGLAGAGTLPGPAGGAGYPAGGDAPDAPGQIGVSGSGASGPFGGGGTPVRSGNLTGFAGKNAHGYGASGSGASGYYNPGSGPVRIGGNGAPGFLKFEW